MQDEITDEDLSPRVGLSIRLGAGLGIVYVLMFIACLINIRNVVAAAEVAFAVLVAVVLVGYGVITHGFDYLFKSE